MEILIITFLMFFAFINRGLIDPDKFIKDNKELFLKLKESDYDFLVLAKYGTEIDPDILFEKRIKNALIIMVTLLFLFINNFSFINIIAAIGVAFFIFKSGYTNLKNYYKSHLHEIDLLLPYYLKSLEILIQHYTVPVAIQRSYNDAPEIFKDGLKDLIASIDAGDSSIDPYMDFAKKYPVRDSMRMMRLLYRLGLGDQEKKQNQLIVFSRTISTLQAKSRETKYKERLDKMEKKTMVMLSTTGIGVMLILLLSLIKSFNM
jgi:hypothetical protein